MSITDFVGSIPEKYDAKLGPFLFEPFAQKLAARVALLNPSTVLKLACGTGIDARAVKTATPNARLVATDLNQAMIDIAKKKFTAGEVEFRVVDAQSLPFDDQSFDVVTCQFGIMFVPDKDAALNEALRVLKPGGTVIFSVWDSTDVNLPAKVAQEVVFEIFKKDPPLFYNTPYGFNDRRELRSLLERNGFVNVKIEPDSHDAESPSARDLADGFLAGNPIFLEIQGRDEMAFDDLHDLLTAKLAKHFGDHPLRARIQAIFCSGVKPG